MNHSWLLFFWITQIFFLYFVHLHIHWDIASWTTLERVIGFFYWNEDRHNLWLVGKKDSSNKHHVFTEWMWAISTLREGGCDSPNSPTPPSRYISAFNLVILTKHVYRFRLALMYEAWILKNNKIICLGSIETMLLIRQSQTCLIQYFSFSKTCKKLCFSSKIVRICIQQNCLCRAAER